MPSLVGSNMCQSSPYISLMICKVGKSMLNYRVDGDLTNVPNDQMSVGGPQGRPKMTSGLCQMGALIAWPSFAHFESAGTVEPQSPSLISANLVCCP